MRLLEQWPHVKLGAVCSKIGSGATPRGGESVYLDEGTAIIRSQNVYNGQFTTSGLAHLTEEHANKLSGVTVESRDVLLNITGDSVARCCQVPDQVLPARVNQHVAIVRPDPAQLTPEFLRYYFVSPLMQKYLLSRAGSGGTRNGLTKRMIEDLEVPCPNMATQLRIVDLLSNYDDLIENNRRRIQLLEQAARLLYKEWFVYLRFPGHERVTITGGVPDGWAKGTVADLGEIITGKTPSTRVPENFGGNVPFVKTPDMHRSRVIVATEETLSERGAATQANKSLPAGTILVACIGAKLGVVSITSRLCQTNQQINAVIPRNDYLRYYGLIALIDLKPRLEALGGGATMPNVNKTKFSSIPVLIPSSMLLREFEAFAKIVLQQMQVLHEQVLCLGRARDLLLPRLMNGEVAV